MKLDDILVAKYPEYKGQTTIYTGGKDICGYLPLYEKYLPNAVDDFLEIGIAMGISIKMFRDYYEGKGNFHAINMDWGNAGVISKRELSEQGIICHEGDQSDVDFLSTIETQFDVIIDDGSHRSDHQIITFKKMFRDNLKSGGVYIIEDLHCCQEPYWWGDIVRFSDTMLSLLSSMKQTKVIPIVNQFQILNPASKGELTSAYFLSEESAEFNQLIKEVYLHSPSIAFIFKS